MELLGNFGFDPVLLVAQILNFLLILFVLKRFLYKPILKMLKDRQDQVTLGLKQAEESKILLENTEIKEKEILKKARLTAEQIIKEAQMEAADKALVIETNAKEQGQRLIEDAKKQIELSEKETERKLATYVSKLAIELLTKSSKELFSVKEQKEIAENALRKIKQ